MSDTIVYEKIQDIIDKEFNKILVIDIGDKSYKIAIRKDQIPKIKQVKIKDDKVVIITLSDNIKSPNTTQFLNFIKNDEGEIKGIIISDYNKLNESTYRTKINKYIVEEIKKIPEENTKQILFKHKQKRIAHAISEIIKYVSDNKLTEMSI